MNAAGSVAGFRSRYCWRRRASLRQSEESFHLLFVRLDLWRVRKRLSRHSPEPGPFAEIAVFARISVPQRGYLPTTGLPEEFSAPSTGAASLEPVRCDHIADAGKGTRPRPARRIRSSPEAVFPFGGQQRGTGLFGQHGNEGHALRWERGVQIFRLSALAKPVATSFSMTAAPCRGEFPNPFLGIFRHILLAPPSPWRRAACPQ